MSESAPSSSTEPFVPTAAAPPQPAARSTWVVPTLIALAYLVFWQVAPRLHTDSMPAVLLSTVVSLGLVIWFTAEIARREIRPAKVALTAVILAAVVIPLRYLLATRHPAAMLIWHFMPGLVDLLFIWFAACIGGLLSFLLRGANMIPPVAAVLALVDVWTVLLGGPVKKIIESPHPAAQAVVHAMTVQLPQPKTGGAAPISVIGFADFLFIAFFVSALCRFVPRKSTYPRMLGALMVVLCAYMLVVFITGLGLPALVPMAVVMIALHWRHFHYERSEAFALLYAALFIALIAAGFWYFGRAPGPPEPPRAALPSLLG